MTKTYTMDDVRAAKIKAVEARQTRNGLDTVDYILSQVRDEQHLQEAIAYLAQQNDRP